MRINIWEHRIFLIWKAKTFFVHASVYAGKKCWMACNRTNFLLYWKGETLPAHVQKVRSFTSNITVTKTCSECWDNIQKTKKKSFRLNRNPEDKSYLLSYYSFMVVCFSGGFKPFGVIFSLDISWFDAYAVILL